MEVDLCTAGDSMCPSGVEWDMVYEEGVRARPRTYMRQKKGGDVIADIYRDRSNRGTGIYGCTSFLVSFSCPCFFGSDKSRRGIPPVVSRDLTPYVLVRIPSSPDSERACLSDLRLIAIRVRK